MNICMIGNFFPPIRGGSSHYIYKLSQYLVKRGHDVTVITSQTKGAERKEIMDGIKVYRLPSIPYPKLSIAHNFSLTYTFTPQNLIRMLGIMKKGKFDLVYAHGQIFDLTISGTIAAKLLGLPLAIMIHTFVEHSQPLINSILCFVDKTFVKRMMQCADRVIWAGTSSYNYIKERYDIPKERLAFSSLGIDIDMISSGDGSRVRERHNLGSDQVILSLGHVHSLRDRILLIKSMHDVLKEIPTAKLVIVGDVYIEEPVNLVKELDIEKSVIFTGSIPFDEVPDYFAAATIVVNDFVLASTGLGTAYLEAMAAGKACVAGVEGDCYGDRGIENGKNIILVPPSDLKAISKGIISLLDDKTFREMIGENARKVIEEHFTWDVVCDYTEKMYESIESGDTSKK